MMKVTIGVTTYGPEPRVEKFFSSLRNNLDPHFEVSMVCVDDGTESADIVRQREVKARQYGFQFIHHEIGRGVPAAWNTILKHATENASEIVAIFNDSIGFLSPGWLTRLASVFQNNQQIGTVGLPICNEPDFDDSESESFWGRIPSLVGSAGRHAFAIQPDVALSIENPDGSRGFWEDMVSFQEWQMGSRLAEKGYASYILPWPPVYNTGESSLGMSPELLWREPSDYLPMDDFLQYARTLRWYTKEYESAYAKGRCDHLTYSRAMFCKYWRILDMERKWSDPQNGEVIDIYDEPQQYVRHQCADTLQGRTVTWLNKVGIIEKSVV